MDENAADNAKGSACDPSTRTMLYASCRLCIERWLAQGNRTCPVTGMRLRHLELTPNFALRNAIQASTALHKALDAAIGINLLPALNRLHAVSLKQSTDYRAWWPSFVTLNKMRWLMQNMLGQTAVAELGFVICRSGQPTTTSCCPIGKTGRMLRSCTNGRRRRPTTSCKWGFCTWSLQI